MLIVIDGSGRSDGNGALLADMIMNQYPQAKRLNLRDISFTCCDACGECRKKNTHCTKEDGLAPYYIDFMRADGIILISPTHYGLPSGLVKSFIDRLYCMKKPRKLSRFKDEAKMLFFMTQGSRRKIWGIVTLIWLKIIMNNHKCGFKGIILPDCSFDDHLGITQKEREIKRALKQFINNKMSK